VKKLVPIIKALPCPEHDMVGTHGHCPICHRDLNMVLGKKYEVKN
jgi:hypothetical protein